MNPESLCDYKFPLRCFYHPPTMNNVFPDITEIKLSFAIRGGNSRTEIARTEYSQLYENSLYVCEMEQEG